MFKAIFSRTLALKMDGHAKSILAKLETIRVKQLLPFLYNEDNWYAGTDSGGPHMDWDVYKDGFDGSDGGSGITFTKDNGSNTDMPGFGGIKYETLRAPMVAAFKGVQEESQQLVALVQVTQTKVYDLIDGPAADLTAFQPSEVKASEGQPYPPEFEGDDYNIYMPSDETVKVCDEAIALLKKHMGDGTLATKLFTDVAETEFKIKDLARSNEGDKMYYSWLLAKSVLLSEGFHARLAACLGPHATALIHANMKTVLRSRSKVEADYMKRAKPQFRWLFDILRLTVVVDNHREMERCMAKLATDFTISKLKIRLAGDTHDVLAVVEYEDLLCEVQFTFASVLLMKKFSHQAYNLTRVDLSSLTGFREMLDATFAIPKMANGFQRAGGYSTRSKDAIATKLVL